MNLSLILVWNVPLILIRKKSKVMAIIKEIRKKNHTTMKCVHCGKEIPSYWYYKEKGRCGDYSYIGYCANCEDVARYTGNL